MHGVISAKAARRQVKTAPLEPYDEAQFTLIPLYPYDAVVTRYGNEEKAGKRPIHGSWSTRAYDNATTIALAEADNNNVGVRMTPDRVVLDVDPRNGGTQGLADLRRDFPSLDSILDTAPMVHTGGGGFHYYLSKPADCKVLDTHPDYPGVEFKSAGRQLVAAGSIHPITGKYYRWDESPKRNTLEDLHEIPHDLLSAIKRGARAAPGEGGGDYSPAHLEKVLSLLDPTDYRENGRWLPLMMGCHHASGGDARDEFIAWSITDPEYSDQADLIGRRWDSCHKEKGDGYTFATLRKEVHAKKKAHLLPAQPNASDDFDALDEFEAPAWDSDLETFEPNPDDDGIEAAEDNDVLTGINKQYCAVFAGGRFRVMGREGKGWFSSSVKDFADLHENVRVEDGNKSENAARAWMMWGKRRTALGTTIDPHAESGEIVGKQLNLWAGFGVAPKPGSWAHFKRMILEDICDGDKELYAYVIRWVAWKIQNPGLPSEVALVLQGTKGTGKSTFGETLATIFGEHGLVCSNTEQIMGRFNGHMETKCFVYGDEALWGGDKRHEAALKKLVTDKIGFYEHKGLTPFQAPNHAGLVLAGNEKWMVPASMDERRFCVMRVSDRHQVPPGANADHPNSIYWSATHKELDSGGREAFLHYMLTFDLGDWHPRRGVPQTKALAEQKFQTLSGAVRWWYQQLLEEIRPGESLESKDLDWNASPIRVTPASMVRDYTAWNPNRHENVSAKALLHELRKFGVVGGDQRMPGTRKHFWTLLPRGEAMQLFEAEYGSGLFG